MGEDMFLEAKNLYYSYKSDMPDVIKDISVSFEKGTYTAILGHNGSGKSTLAKLLCGLIIPNKGSVVIDGIDTADEEQAFTLRKKCGMVFQNPDNQIVASVVEEDVAFAPENLGIPSKEIREIVDRCLDIVGMRSYAKHSTYKLSGGQKQRVAIAGILAMSPDCIIFDEATAMLDPTGRKDIINAMKELNKNHEMTIITITHHMNEAIEADRVIVMNQGQIAADGTPYEIFSQVEMLQEIGLSVPQVTELCYKLKMNGLPVNTNILHTMEAAEIIEKIFN
ncbi:energy-coupling factor transporter ATPase [Eubacteriales bacterium OttesenSCG-928-G02]|nr:energy-coupling factor transporter ATPase [Eubacteriales bacterium OttesenSCG-928-G02]